MSLSRPARFEKEVYRRASTRFIPELMFGRAGGPRSRVSATGPLCPFDGAGFQQNLELNRTGPSRNHLAGRDRRAVSIPGNGPRMWDASKAVANGEFDPSLNLAVQPENEVLKTHNSAR